MAQGKKSLEQIISYRIEKLERIREKGIDPYPHSFKPSHKSIKIKHDYKSLENKNVKIAGRIMAIRKMGKASFAQILDGEGRIQIFVKENIVGSELYENFKLLDIGDFIGLNGNVFKTKTGEISINTESIVILAKSIRPLPIVKEKNGEKFDAFDDKEQRYRNRHLDLIVNPEIKKTFVLRAKIIKRIRDFLDGNQFLEVETPILQPLYGGANARPFTTHHNSLDQKFYLRIADELYLKRLVIGGMERVYEISKDFRNEGIDRNHNPEFTMLEFYWAYADYYDNMNIVEDLIRETAKSIKRLKITWGEKEIDLSKPFQKSSFYVLLQEATGHDVENCSENEVYDLCKKFKLDVNKNSNHGQILDILFSNLVEPKLINPTFVMDYPKSISPLAKLHRNNNKKIVERFELFIGGSEFANSFTELNDPIDQRERLEQQAALKDLGDEEAQPLDENFLEAMECGMPPTGGVGLGIDRLTMLLTENRWIKDVILFPALRTK